MVGSYERSHDLCVMVISPHAVVIVGFTSREKVVTEGETFDVCASVTQPGPSSAMGLTFSLNTKLIPLTAGLCVCVCVCVWVCMCVCVCVSVLKRFHQGQKHPLTLQPPNEYCHCIMNS